MSLLALAVGGRGVVDPEEPVLHADDEGLLRGRAAFETLRVYGGRPFRLSQHLERLRGSAERIGLPPVDTHGLASLAEQALGAAVRPDVVLRLLWTAGRSDAQPVALALVTAIPADLDELRARGIELVSLLGVRGEAPWLLGGVKSTSYAVNMSAEAEARRRGAYDAVFVDAERIVLEGPVTNIWWRVGATLFTPALELGILAGITRAFLLEQAPREGYVVHEGRFALAGLAAADEAFTSSSVRELLPVVELDGEPIGDARPGDAALTLQAALRTAAEDERRRR